MSTEIVVFAMLFAGVAYLGYRWLQIHLMQPLRLSFADEGLKLLNSSRLSEGEKDVVDRYLDDAFDWKFGPVIAAVLIPVLVIDAIASWVGRPLKPSPDLEGLAKRPEARKFIDLHAACILGSNPLFAIIIFLEMILLFVPAALVFGGARQVWQVVSKDVIGRFAIRSHAH